MFLLASCFSCFRESRTKFECFHYPSQIDSLKARDLYDSARWVIYTWLGDRKLDEYYYSEMELHYKWFFYKNDTLVLFFRFYNPKSLSLTEKMRGVANARVAFSMNTRKKLWAFSIDDFSDALKSGDPELDSPPSPRALHFIQTHKDSLNCCFRELALKMKIIQN